MLKKNFKMVNKIKNWNWNRIGIYHFKWQIGFVIIWPCLELCYKILELGTLPALILSNFIGALLFYPIDLFIFNKTKNKKKDD